MTSFRRRGSLCSTGAASRQNCVTSHLILSSWGRASNSACVVASGGGELSAWTVVGEAVTSCTTLTRVSGSRSTSSHSRLSINSQASVSLHLLQDRVIA